MSWYRTGTVTVATGSKNVTGVGTLWASSVNVGDAFALVDANGNPTGAWYEVEEVTSNTALVLKQTYTGTPAPGSNKQYAVFNLVGNMTTPSFAQRLAQFFDQFQNLVDLPTTTPTASSIPVADSGGKIADGWIPATVARLASPALTGSPTAPTQTASDDSTKIATTAHVKNHLNSMGIGSGYISTIGAATSTDWNDLPTELGGSMSWKFVNGGTTTTNAPPMLTSAAYTHFYVTHIRYNSNTILQIAMPYSGSVYDASVYIRSCYQGTWRRWYRQYSQYNLLGTVSQSDGVPTGAVIERGSNANGSYVKFADGTMIATFNATLSSGSYTWTYPVAFAAAPQVSAIQVVGTATDLVSTTCSTPGTGSVNIYGNISTDSGTSWVASTSAIRLTAIGRWF